MLASASAKGDDPHRIGGDFCLAGSVFDKARCVGGGNHLSDLSRCGKGEAGKAKQGRQSEAHPVAGSEHDRKLQAHIT